MIRVTILAFASLLLTACQLVSDKPLIEISQGQRLLGERVSVLALDEDGALYHDESGGVSVSEMRFRRGGYYFDGEDGEEALSVSFHSIPGVDGLYLTQLVGAKGDTTIYGVSRRTSEKLYFKDIDLDETTLAALKGSGLDIEKSGDRSKVKSRAELNEVVRLWTQINLRELENIESFDLHYLIEGGAGTGLRNRALSSECLAIAGHPEDPAVKRLSKKWRKGMPLAEIDIERALPVCREAAAQDRSPSVRYSLARVFEAKKDHRAAERLLTDLMVEDFPLAFIMAAEHRVYGNGVAKDLSLARTILHGPATRGQIMPAYLLGMYELNGTLGAVNHAEAQRWLQVAAKGGISDAQYQLGLILDDEPSGKAAAYRNFRSAATQGHVQAAYRAGYALYFGNGVASDKKAAFKDFQTAASGDVAWAQYFVGFMQARGQGTSENSKSAVGWLQRAHEAGIVAATGELGRMVYHGFGTTADKVQGKRLLDEASSKGDKNAKTYLAALKPPPPKTAAQKYNAPGERAADVNKLAEGKPFQLTEQNLPFMTGVASHLLERCKAPSDNSKLRAELTIFVTSSSLGSVMGFDYSNPNLGETLGSMGRSQAALVAGSLFAQQLPCGAVANQFNTGIAKALRSNARGSDGGLSNFVESCTPHFDQRRCSCLANLGRQAIPDLHRQFYDRRLIREIIERNPLLGLQIGIACQIGNY